MHFGNIKINDRASKEDKYEQSLSKNLPKIRKISFLKTCKNKILSAYHNWQNSSTYAGEVKIITHDSDLPIVEINNISYQPKRFLCEIVSSELYPVGHKKHFIIAFTINDKLANHLNLKYNNKIERDDDYTTLTKLAVLCDNLILDYPEDIELAETIKKTHNYYASKRRGIPKDVYKIISTKAVENYQYRMKKIEEMYEKQKSSNL